MGRDRGLAIGIGLMLASVLAIAMGSVFAKMLLAEMPASQVLWLRFAGFCAAVLPIALIWHGRELLRPYRPDRQAARGLIGVAVAYCLILAIDDIGVSQAIAAFYVYPAISYGLGIARLGEPASMLKWLAVAVGFVGVIIAINPSFESTPPGLAYALLAAGLAAVRVVLYRADAAQSPPMVAALWDRGVGAILAAVALAFVWTPISASATGAVIGLIASSVAAQLLFVYAIRQVPIGVLAPFAFWEVAFAIMLDIYVLDAAHTWRLAAGAFLIVGAGVLITLKRPKKQSA